MKRLAVAILCIMLIPFSACSSGAQTTEYSCGAASALMVLNHYDYHQLNELEICSLAETDSSKGTSVEGLVKFFNGIGWKTDHHAGTDFYFASIEDAEKYLIDRIDAGTPVMVDWEDWRGHWQVIIGIDTCGSIEPYVQPFVVVVPAD